MAINSVLTTDSITVFGPPETIEVALDIGPSGERGSLIYSGSGDPNVNTGAFVNESPKINDLYVRTDAGGDYGVVYQYNAIPGGNEWQSILKFQPVLYNDVQTLVFAGGSASVTIPLSEIYENAPATLTSDNLSIQLTPEHSEAIAHSVTTKALTSGSNRSALFIVKAKEITGSIANLSGSVNFNVAISIVL